MIEPTIIRVVDKAPQIVAGPSFFVCDNSNYPVQWVLDEEWTEYEHRTMRVNYADGSYDDVVFTGNECYLPSVPVAGRIEIGLYAGDIHTTRTLSKLAVRSATSSGGTPRAPMPNGYAQVIQALEAKLDTNQGTANRNRILVVGENGEVEPGPSLPTDLDALAALMDAGMIEPITDTSGALLVDERGTVLTE